jgi:hypothetical protein
MKRFLPILNLAIAFFLAIISLPALPAQSEFAPVGAFWDYHYEGHSGNESGQITFWVEKDTTFNGDEGRKLEVHIRIKEFMGGSYETISYTCMLLRNDSIFMGAPGNFRFRFSFSMEVGDTLPMSGFIPENARLVVDSISEVEIKGENRNVWFVNKYCSLDMVNFFLFETIQIIENIGPVNDYLPYWNEDGCTVLGGGTYWFQCYSESAFNWPSGQDCMPLLLSSEEPERPSKIQVFPNPAQQSFQVQWVKEQPYQLMLFDTQGQEVLRRNRLQRDQVVDIGHLPKGLYFLEILDREGKDVHVEKMIVF